MAARTAHTTLLPLRRGYPLYKRALDLGAAGWARRAGSGTVAAAMRGSVLPGIFLTCLLGHVVGCGDDGEGTTDSATTGSTTAAMAATTPGAVEIVGQVDVIDLCGISGATTVSFRARKVGCEQGPPAPCTIKVDPYEEVVGDAATCPASQNAAEMRVVVESAGRWEVEARALTDSGHVSRCFGPGTDEVTLVTKAQVEAGASIAVASRTGPCPTP